MNRQAHPIQTLSCFHGPTHPLPRPGTPGRGQGRGVVLSRGTQRPLFPTLSPAYRGEGEGARRSMLRDLELFLTVALRTGADGWARRAADVMSVYFPPIPGGRSNADPPDPTS